MHLSGRGWACSNGKGTLRSTDVCKLSTKIWAWEILTNFWYCLLNGGWGWQSYGSQCYILVNPVIDSSLQVWYAYCVVCTILWTKRGCTLVSRWHSVNSILSEPGVPARGVNYALLSIFKRRRLQEGRFLNVVGRRGVINYHEASWLDLEVTVSNKLVSLNGRRLHHSCDPCNTVCTNYRRKRDPEPLHTF